MQTLRHARLDFFRREGLPADGGYDSEWFEASFGPVRYRIRNFAHRADALFRHDLHHVVTGYRTDWRGEVAINAWELGAGLGGHLWGAVIMLMGFALGLLLTPLETFRAFTRGRRSTNLYTVDLPDGALDRPASELSTLLGVVESASPRSSDALAFLGAAVVSTLFFSVAALPLLGLVLHAALVSGRRWVWRASCCGSRCSALACA